MAWHRRCARTVVKARTNVHHAVYIRCTGRIDESARERKRKRQRKREKIEERAERRVRR